MGQRPVPAVACVPTKAAIFKARTLLGYQVMEELFSEGAVPLAKPGARGSCTGCAWSRWTGPYWASPTTPPTNASTTARAPRPRALFRRRGRWAFSTAGPMRCSGRWSAGSTPRKRTCFRGVGPAGCLDAAAGRPRPLQFSGVQRRGGNRRPAAVAGEVRHRPAGARGGAIRVRPIGGPPWHPP
jgi:hypothetical protein